MIKETMTCPCGSKQLYLECCGLYLEKSQLAPNPEALMRSRYTAFTLGNTDYLKATWHSETLPELSDSEPSNWIDLKIIESWESEDGLEGEVEFIAKLIYEDKLESLHEVSDFVRVNDRWVYHSGEFVDSGCTTTKISMKADCPCGSGTKFKNCHFSKN